MKRYDAINFQLVLLSIDRYVCICINEKQGFKLLKAVKKLKWSGFGQWEKLLFHLVSIFGEDISFFVANFIFNFKYNVSNYPSLTSCQAIWNTLIIFFFQNSKPTRLFGQVCIEKKSKIVICGAMKMSSFPVFKEKSNDGFQPVRTK